ncbi:MAG: universal stress protein [Candidatus Binatus sp.]|uniref:universal stress protein n=1 Tax=Candidatus Binatus sp. TaxID=2811406 RepID=UPI0027167717|nr:universal stress protein [Candidatus Binatus sp.]MDO8431229.1 universal stress protein [Candidatus Binatus sp.]
MIQEIRKILAPIDFSDFSMDTLRGAMELAQDVNAELHIVHIVAPHFALLEKSREQVRETLMLDESEQELSRIKKEQFANSPKVIIYAEIGPPVPKLAAYAKEHQIDLIMLATHGRTGPQHIMIGSVAEKLARLAPCSVLVFRRRTP